MVIPSELKAPVCFGKYNYNSGKEGEPGKEPPPSAKCKKSPVRDIEKSHGKECRQPEGKIALTGVFKICNF